LSIASTTACIKALTPCPDLEDVKTILAHLVGRSCVVALLSISACNVIDLWGIESHLLIATTQALPSFNTFFDTAGIRKRASVDLSVGSAEVMSVYQAFTAIKQADVVILVLDVNDGPTIQDYRISERVLKEGRACVVAINKWDSIPHKSITLQAEMLSNATTQLRPTKWANIVFTSSKSGQGVKALMQAVVEANTEHKRRITTASLNHILSEIKIFLSSDSVRAIRTKAKIYFGVQVSTRPPTFIIFVNDPKLFRGVLQKLIEKKIRENVGFKGTPIRLIWRGKTTKKIEK
jgi:GTP-binding protein